MNRVQRNEEGAALLIALGIIALFGLTLAAMLGFADTSLRASETLERQRDEVYAADAAIEKTIADMRGNANVGKFGGAPCGQTVPELNGLTVVVTCTPDSTSGSGGGGGGNGDAIITTATQASGEYGIYRDANGNLEVGGNIRSNSTILLGGGGTITSTGDITAAGACDAGVTQGPGKTLDCGNGTVTAVPSYSHATINTTSRTGPSTACTTPLSVVKFKPGTYTSAAALTNAMRTTSLCTKSLFYFEPGTYYFNFASGDDEWVVNDANVNVVGGVPLNWALPSDAAAPLTVKPVLAFPGACDTSVPGVQFVFSGASRLRVDAGTVELCPAAAVGSDPPISIYGSTNVLETVTLTPTGFEAGGQFTPEAGAYTISDGGTAKAALTSGQTGNITLTGFDQSVIPAGATIDTVTLRVAHQEGNGPGQGSNADLASGSVTLSKAGVACAPAYPLAKKTNMATESFNAEPCLDTPAAFGNIKATYSVSAQTQSNKALDDFLDGIAIDVTYSAPGLVPSSGCITEPGFPQSGSDGTHCALLKVSGNSSNVVLHGMLYAPTAALDLNAASGSQQGYLRGIVARTILANITPSVAFAPTISTVSGGAGLPNDRLVELVATINSVVRLRATVRFDDQPLAGDHVVVNRWTVVR